VIESCNPKVRLHLACASHTAPTLIALKKNAGMSFGELKQFWRAFRDRIYADHQHRKSERKGRIDEGFYSVHVVASNKPVFLAAAAVNKFSN